MINKFFNVTVKPTITASKQHAGAFAAGDILFDWTAFDVPKGSSALNTAAALIRGVNGVDQPAVDMELFFAKSIDGVAPSSLGTINAAVNLAGWFNNLIGFITFDVSANSIGSSNDLVYMNMVQMGNRGGEPNVVLTGEPDTGTNVGYDKIWVAGIAQGALDFSTTVIARGGESVDVTTVKVDKGADNDPSAGDIFAVGDVLHSGTDDVLGTLTSFVAFDTNHAKLGFSAGITGAISDDEEIYNVNPITLVFSFEK